MVGSGDLEVLLEPADGDTASVRIRTSVDGFKDTWKAVLDRFFGQYDGAVHIEINDAGATPGAVSCDSNKQWRRVKHERILAEER